MSAGMLAFLLRTEILLALLILSAGCRAPEGWAPDEVIAYVEGPLLEEAERFVSETAGEEFRELQDAADADRDGDTSWAEWWSFVFGGSGGLWLLGWLIKTFGNRQRSRGESREGETAPCSCPEEQEQEIVLLGGQPSDRESSRPWYEAPVSPPASVACPPA